MASTSRDVPGTFHCSKHAFQLTQLLGSGSTGEVFLAYPLPQKKGRKTAPDYCALKVVQLSDRAASKQSQLRAEVFALRTMGKHPNIISLQNCGFDSGSATAFIQFGYAPGGDLLSRIEKGPFSEAEAVFLFRDILSAMAHAHSKGICHRDLKLENILLHDNNALVADWGLSAQFSPGIPMTKDCGSLHYAAPEILSASPYFGHLVDSFSLGILFFAMVTGCFPFFGNSPRERFLDILTRKHLPFPSHISPLLKDLITQLLAFVPTSRLTPAQALQHQWFDQIREPSKSVAAKIFDTIIISPVSSIPASIDSSSSSSSSSSKKSPATLMAKIFSK